MPEQTPDVGDQTQRAHDLAGINVDNGVALARTLRADGADLMNTRNSLARCATVAMDAKPTSLATVFLAELAAAGALRLVTQTVSVDPYPELGPLLARIKQLLAEGLSQLDVFCTVTREVLATVDGTTRNVALRELADLGAATQVLLAEQTHANNGR